MGHSRSILQHGAASYSERGVGLLLVVSEVVGQAAWHRGVGQTGAYWWAGQGLMIYVCGHGQLCLLLGIGEK